MKLDSHIDEQYVAILLEPLRKCADYLPKMGGQEEVDLDGFTMLYGADPLYRWIGLDSPLMFAAHKAAGGMTSVYRQLGIGCERIFRQVLRDQLGLTSEQVAWSYEVLPEDIKDEVHERGKPRILSLDGRIELADIQCSMARQRIQEWLYQQCRLLNITMKLKGAVFEVRQGYKSADSKRQNADLANAAQALGHGFLPVLTLMSTQINHVVGARYKIGNWAILTGTIGSNNTLYSTFDFLREVVGFDLAAFFERNAETLRNGTESVLAALLDAKR